ncbi:MAG: hypothetical protein N2489_04875 [Clostridia bacterium]|nr:hypothetical protein [Clostridia bacterium]
MYVLFAEAEAELLDVFDFVEYEPGKLLDDEAFELPLLFAADPVYPELLFAVLLLEPDGLLLKEPIFDLEEDPEYPPKLFEEDRPPENPPALPFASTTASEENKKTKTIIIDNILFFT